MVGGQNWMRLVAAALLACLPAAGHAAEAPSCVPERVATLPIDLERHLALVPVTINGTQVWMGVDTGTQTTLVTQDAAARLGLPRDPAHRTNVVSGAGMTLVQNVRLNDMQIGDVMFSAMSVAAVPLEQPDGVHRLADGLLGADVLSSYDVEFDFAGRTLSLYSVPGCGRVQPPWTGAYAAVPVTLTRTRGLVLPVQIDGQDMTALFDSGSDIERVARSSAARAGVTDAMLARDPGASGLAAGGPTHVVSAHRFMQFRVADEIFRNPTIGVGSLPEAGADMLLGLEYMRTRRFWLSYATHVIYIQARPAAASAP